MSSPAARDKSRRARTQQIENFAHTYELNVSPLNNGYQLRIENLVDLYPVNGRYCILQTGERGDWNSTRDLRQLILRAIPDQMPHLRTDGYLEPRPPQIISNIRTMTEAEYNKPLRRLWRWLRRK